MNEVKQQIQDHLKAAHDHLITAKNLAKNNHEENSEYFEIAYEANQIIEDLIGLRVQVSDKVK